MMMSIIAYMIRVYMDTYNISCRSTSTHENFGGGVEGWRRFCDSLAHDSTKWLMNRRQSVSAVKALDKDATPGQEPPQCLTR